MKNFNQTFFNNNKSRNQISLMNKYPSSKLIELNQNFDSLSSLSALSGIADNSLNKNYKQFALRQINMQIDTKMLGLIAKLNDEKTLLTVSTYLDGEYNEKDIYIGVPAVVTNKGVREILKLPLNEQDQEKLSKSANILRDTINKLKL